MKQVDKSRFCDIATKQINSWNMRVSYSVVNLSFFFSYSDRDDVYKTAKRVKQEVGDVAILVNNAGVVTGKKLLNIPDRLVQRTLNVNLMAHFWVCLIVVYKERSTST